MEGTRISHRKRYSQQNIFADSFVRQLHQMKIQVKFCTCKYYDITLRLLS